MAPSGELAQSSGGLGNKAGAPGGHGVAVCRGRMQMENPREEGCCVGSQPSPSPLPVGGMSGCVCPAWPRARPSLAGSRARPGKPECESRCPVLAWAWRGAWGQPGLDGRGKAVSSNRPRLKAACSSRGTSQPPCSRQSGPPSPSGSCSLLPQGPD